MPFFEMARIAIRTVFSRPATLMYPTRPAKRTEISRGHVVIDGSRCISCLLCMKRCPAEALCVDKEARTWTIDRLRCVVCKCCVDVCPVSCLTMDARYSPCLTLHSGLQTFPITYVRPVRPEESGKTEPPAGPK
jgi:ech hydrogenase subunit F